MAGFARSALRRRIVRDARGLAPSIELPWTPPWGDELGSDVVDLVADVMVLQADVASDRHWADDADGRRLRERTITAAGVLRTRCTTHGMQASADSLREIAAATRAWEALAPGARAHGGA